MIPRLLESDILTALGHFPVVGIFGPRQVGKTTLALHITEHIDRPTTYLDLELDSDQAKLQDAELYLAHQQGKLIIIDEIQRRPDLFPLLRGIVDRRIRGGDKNAHFLILGSASRDLLQQSSESLAGRIAYLNLAPFSFLELQRFETDFDYQRLWLRGGFPGSYLAADDQTSWLWRGNFITTYLERDIPQLGLRLPAERMRRLWSMLALGQGELLNISRLAASLGVSGHTVRHYLDILTDLYMVRQLPPWSGNSRKRLTKSPKVYVRDSGLIHRLANIPELEILLGHPLCGASWEGFAIENLLHHMPDSWTATYYRTSAQAEIDLILEGPADQTFAIEIKRTLSPHINKGFRLGCEDIAATRRYYVIPEGEPYPLGADTVAIPLQNLIYHLAEAWKLAQ
ncbi:MAG: ATP-binding protein [Gammaproteobacteria bacterium]